MDGRLFHRRAAATGNTLSLTVDRWVRRTSRDVDEAERSRRLASVSRSWKVFFYSSLSFSSHQFFVRVAFSFFVVPFFFSQLLKELTRKQLQFKNIKSAVKQCVLRITKAKIQRFNLIFHFFLISQYNDRLWTEFRQVVMYTHAHQYFALKSNNKQATYSPFKPVDKKVMIMIGHGGYLAHQMCKYHVRRDAAKLRILYAHRKITKDNINRQGKRLQNGFGLNRRYTSVRQILGLR